jgi:hypothetical protein
MPNSTGVCASALKSIFTALSKELWQAMILKICSTSHAEAQTKSIFQKGLRLRASLPVNSKLREVHYTFIYEVRTLYMKETSKPSST